MKRSLTYILLLAFLSFFASCINDTDFKQAEEIALTPAVELDLIYFTVDANRFYDFTTQNEMLMISDTTDIRFLDGTEVQKSLKRADFYFKFTNSIPRQFLAEFNFLSEENILMYHAQTSVQQGTVETPVITEFTEVVEGENIQQLTQANKVVVKVTIPSSDASLEGTLNLQSKATYYIEY